MSKKGKAKMAGIISCGAYVPVHRLSRAVIGENWEMRGLPGEKAVANYDEDSLTMAIAAARSCLKRSAVNQVDALYFATTTAPYLEKMNSALMAAVLQLPVATHTMDFSNSLRCGTSALGAAVNAVNSGSVETVLVCVADVRSFRPKSHYEMFCGDGAVALLVGKEDTIAEIEFFDPFYDEIQDVWRTGHDRFIRSAEDRFVQDIGYGRVVGDAVAKSLVKHDLRVENISKVCSNFTNAKIMSRLFKGLGFSPEKHLATSQQMEIGDTGSSMALLNAVSALEQAVPGQRILISNYGNGCDNICIKTGERIADFAPAETVQKQLVNKIQLKSYNRYLIWRDLIDVQTTPRPPLQERQPTPPAQWRENKGELPLCGTKCEECGTPQYPPQRVCMICKTKDNFTSYNFSSKRGKVFSFSHDYVMETLDPPVTSTVVDFEGGGRIICDMTDREIDVVRVDMDVEMTFRKLYCVGGINNYWWKCKPVSLSE